MELLGRLHRACRPGGVPEGHKDVLGPAGQVGSGGGSQGHGDRLAGQLGWGSRWGRRVYEGVIEPASKVESRGVTAGSQGLMGSQCATAGYRACRPGGVGGHGGIPGGSSDHGVGGRCRRACRTGGVRGCLGWGWTAGVTEVKLMSPGGHRGHGVSHRSQWSGQLRIPYPTGGALLLVEAVLAKGGAGPLRSLLLSLNMMLQAEGWERQASDYRNLATRAGFPRLQLRRPGGPYHAMLARRGPRPGIITGVGSNTTGTGSFVTGIRRDVPGARSDAAGTGSGTGNTGSGIMPSATGE